MFGLDLYRGMAITELDPRIISRAVRFRRDANRRVDELLIEPPQRAFFQDANGDIRNHACLIRCAGECRSTIHVLMVPLNYN